MRMKLSSLSLGTTTGLFLAVALSACGGGGSDAPAAAAPVSVTPTPAATTPVAVTPTPTPSVFTQNDAKLAAGLGLSTAQLVYLQAQQEQGFIGGLFQGLTGGNASGSFPATTVSCASSAGGSGTFTFGETKSGTYVGYRVNDSQTLSFNACKFASSTVVVNGRYALVSRGNYVNLSSNSAVEYSVTTTDFDISIGTGTSAAKFRSNGIQTAKFDTILGGVNAPDVTLAVVSGRATAFFSPATALSPSFSFAMNPGMGINAKLTAASNFAISMDGGLSGVFSAGSVPMLFATSSALTGPFSATAGLLPTAGTMRVKDTALNLQTETTYLGSIATVKADTNRDGILDLTFNTTPQALMTP
jgi:hypothetical protein